MADDTGTAGATGSAGTGTRTTSTRTKMTELLKIQSHWCLYYI